MHKKRFQRRSIRTYLLLEVMIAFALATLTLSPLIKPHLAISKIERGREESEIFERLSRVALADLKVLLYENRLHSWKELSAGNLEGDLGLLETEDGRTITCHYHLERLQHMERNHKKDRYLLMRASITFVEGKKVSAPFSYAFILEQHPLSVAS